MKHVREDDPRRAERGARTSRRRWPRSSIGPRPRTSRAATRTPRAWRPTSRRCWPSRPPAAGRRPGEATAVLRTLPGSARRRLPMRIRHPRLALVGRRRARGAGGARRRLRWPSCAPTAAPAWRPTSWSRASARSRCRSAELAAHDYNPFGNTSPSIPRGRPGGRQRHAARRGARQHYVGGNLGKPGSRPVPGRRARVSSPRRSRSKRRRPGSALRSTWPTRSPRAPSAPRQDLAALGLEGAAGRRAGVHDDQHVKLDTAGQRFRYYLVWITKLPPGQPGGLDLGDRRCSGSARGPGGRRLRSGSARSAAVALDAQAAEPVDELRDRGRRRPRTAWRRRSSR